MSRAGRSLFLFGMYVIVAGILLLCIPNVLFSSLGMPSCSSFIVFLAAFVLLGVAKPVLILLGVIDLAGALWTFLALRASA